MTTPPGGESAGAEFTEADLRGARFRMVDLRDASFRLVDLSHARIRGARFFGADLDGDIDGLHVCGVSVAPLIEAELDRRHPERAVFHASDPVDLVAGWAGLEAMWAATIERVAAMPAGTPDISVDGEWSLVQTLRHLVLATDAWLGKAILRRARPFHPLGILFSEYAGHEAELGLDDGATPSFAEVLEVRSDRIAMVRDHLAAVTPEDLAGVRKDPWGSEWEPTVLDCLQVIFIEEWQHHRYATRDLAIIQRDAP